ncbi:hypothetical protein MKW92_046922 [Papaver armeniacum]|nr:hypothetical protein MKW92_046922 [Papaver armeniacum]
MGSTSRIISRIFSTTKAIVEDVHVRSGLQQRLPKLVEVFKKANERRRTVVTFLRVFPIPCQHDADLATFQLQYLLSSKGSVMKAEAWKGYQSVLQQRSYLDSSMELIEKYLFGTTEKASTVMKAALRPAGKPVVDDWGSYDTMVETYEKICGPFSPYGRRHKRRIANICNAGVKPNAFAKASDYACSTLGKMPPIYEPP